MGCFCAGRKENLEVEPSYEVICQDIENQLILRKINIKQFITQVHQAQYQDKKLTAKSLSKIYEKYGVKEEVFLKDNSIFMRFYSDLSEENSNLEYVIVSAIPFCKGDSSLKKLLIWECLEETKAEHISYIELIELIIMVVILCTKTIPEIAMQEDASSDEEIKKLAMCSEAQLQTYAATFFPKEPEHGDNILRHEFDAWLSPMQESLFFSPKHHRSQLLSYLARPTETPF